MFSDSVSYVLLPLIVGFLLDSIFGDPLWLPHPIRWFGSVILFTEKRYNVGNSRKWKGIFLTIILVLFTYAFCWIFIRFSFYNLYVYYPLASIFVFYGLANRNLIEESFQVEKMLTKQGLEAGRKQLSFIVGRDTTHLNPNQIRTAVLETLSENLSDGVIAPLFYYAIGGIPLMFAYKMINTLDSMIGYKNERYKQFGFFAARLDDVANFIPARVTALLMVFISGSVRGFVFIFKYGRSHASPNSAYPEAALAGILNTRFGGPNIYHGKLMNKPYIGENDRMVLASDVRKAALVNIATSLFFVFIASSLYVYFSSHL